LVIFTLYKIKLMKNFENLYREARQQAADYTFATNSTNVMQWPCGFAWVNVKPANSAFAKWLVANEYARKDSYLGGVTIWIHEFNQSMNHKESFAMKLAEILRENGIKANDGSRID
jgi:hypothetical protein